LSPGIVRLAVLGDPLRYTLSPELHRAGLEALGIPGDSVALVTPTERLAERLGELAREGFRGCNLTIPLKRAALELVTRASGEARRAQSVNTVGFEPDGRWGDTTDGRGFVAFLAGSIADLRGVPVHMLGAGGAARSLALSLAFAGAAVTASARRPEIVAEAWRELGVVVPWRSPAEAESLARCRVVMNATPLDDPGAIVPLELVSRDAWIVDLRYGPEATPWVVAARKGGWRADDGRGLLVHQARASLRLWFGRDVPLEPLQRAVGGISAEGSR